MTLPLNRPLKAGIAIAILLALGYMDRLTAFEFDVFLFYALPVAMMAWWVGRGPAVLLAAGAVAVWLVADRILEMNPYATVFLAVWNTALRAGWILIVAVTVSALRNAHRVLEERVRGRTAELSAVVGQLQTLTGEMALVEQRERKRLSRLLHDGLQQLLAATRVRIVVWERQGAVSPESCREVFAVLDEAIALSRSLSAELSPTILDTDGLLPALTWLAGWMRDTHHLTVDLKTEPGGEPGSEAARAVLFHAVRELLFNVVKHAGVRQATVDALASDHHIRIVVTDAGAGFDPTRLRPSGPGGLGLPSIRQRLEFIGGTLDIASAPGQGSRITLSVPLQP